MDKLDFEYPVDFQDEVDDAKVLPEPPQFSASAILYSVSAVYFFAGVLVPLLEMMVRGGPKADTLVQMMEMNIFMQVGLFGIAQGLFFFLLGMSVDRRGA